MAPLLQARCGDEKRFSYFVPESATGFARLGATCILRKESVFRAIIIIRHSDLWKYEFTYPLHARDNGQDNEYKRHRETALLRSFCSNYSTVCVYTYVFRPLFACYVTALLLLLKPYQVLY